MGKYLQLWINIRTKVTEGNRMGQAQQTRGSTIMQ